MCNRYSNLTTLVNEVLEERLSRELREQVYFYHTSAFENRAQGIITQKYPDQVHLVKWSAKHANARSEKIFDTWPFKSSIFDKRCIIPATGFYEHRKVMEGKQEVNYPYYIQVKDGDEHKAFFIAGVCGVWDNVPSWAMLTTDANEMMRYIHNGGNHPFRMPVILTKEEAMNWLDPTLKRSDIENFTKPYPCDGMIAHSIAKGFIGKNATPDSQNTVMPFDHQHADIQPVLKGLDFVKSMQ